MTAVCWFASTRPHFYTLSRFEHKLIGKLERNLAYRTDTMRKNPVGHVHIMPLARILNYYVVAVHTTLTNRNRAFGRSLCAQFLRQFLYDAADDLFGNGLFVHDKLYLADWVVRVEYDLGFIPQAAMLFAPVVDFFDVFFFDIRSLKFRTFHSLLTIFWELY